MNPVGIPVVSAQIVIDGQPVGFVKTGDEITVLVNGEEVTGVVKGIELGGKNAPRIAASPVSYDGQVIGAPVDPVCAMIRNAADVFVVKALLLEREDGIHAHIPVAEITELAVAGEAVGETQDAEETETPDGPETAE